MLADFLPLLQEVQLQEEIVRELNQQLLQSKQRLTATEDESSRAHEEFARTTSDLRGQLQREVLEHEEIVRGLNRQLMLVRDERDQQLTSSFAAFEQQLSTTTADLNRPVPVPLPGTAPVPQLPLLPPPLAVPAPQMPPAAFPGQRLAKKRLVIDNDCWPIQVRTTWTDPSTGVIVRTKGSEYTALAVTELKKSKPKNDRTSRIEQEIFKIDKRWRNRYRS